jgi:alkylhydroperoxidase/carboxymuconolactone decarboxylase family protein YurZ
MREVQTCMGGIYIRKRDKGGVMLGVLFRYKAKPEKFEELLDFLKRDGEVCRDQEPGTLRFEFYPDRKDPDPKDADPKDTDPKDGYTLYVYEAYRDRSAFEEHKKNDPFQRWSSGLETELGTKEVLFETDALWSFAEAGQKIYEEVLGKPVFDEKHPPPLIGLRELTVNHLYAKIWNRSLQHGGKIPLISLRERRLITIALLAAQGHSDRLRDHVSGARCAGISKDSLLDLMIHVAHYAGWAAGTAGQKIVLDVSETKSG